MPQLRPLSEVFLHKGYIKLPNEREGFGDIPLSIESFELDVLIPSFKDPLLPLKGSPL